MDPLPSYNLLQAVDPTKIKVPISERFAKLTLSSNKKQQEKCKGSEQKEVLKKQQEKRDSVTRNITKQFDDVDHENKLKSKQNPLLRSESSKETEHNNSIDAADITMEPLAVSDDDDNPTQVEDDVDLLSQQLASMVVEPKAISISSGSIDNLSVFTELVSSESQHSSSTSDTNNVRIVHNIPINVREAAKRETIDLNLTPLNCGDFDKTYEMTDDEEEEEEENDELNKVEGQDEAITLSDTTESLHDQEEDIMATSSLPSTSLTAENLSLPSLIDNKAERVAAFLRDVSIEQRALKDEGQLDFHDTIDMILDNKEIDEIQAKLEKSRHFATADTESMTPDANDETTPKSFLEREKRLKALEGSIDKIVCTENEDTPKNRKVDQIIAKNLQGLAKDDTLDRTVMTEAKTTRKKTEKDAYKIANDETQCNTEYSKSQETHKTPNQSTQNSRRLIDFETQDNTALSINGSYSTPKRQANPCQLANEDTVSNSLNPDFDVVLTQLSADSNHSQDYKTPHKEYRNCSLVSIHSTSHSSVEPDHNQNSIESVIDSSSEINGTPPQHSITISETDDENVQKEDNENSDEKKLSNSFHREDSSDDSNGQMSQIQMSMGSINISAKINIKIHIPLTTSTDSSEDDQAYGPDTQGKKRSTKSSNNLPVVSTEEDNQKDTVDTHSRSGSNEQVVEPASPQPTENNEQEKEIDNSCSSSANDQEITDSNCSPEHCNQSLLKANVEKINASPNKSSDSVEIVEDEKFLTEAEKLLNQLYGKAWQTPEVIRTLTRSSQSSDKNTNNSKSSAYKKVDGAVRTCKNKSTVEESVLVQRDIVKTNLDSTRVVTPKSSMQRKQLSTEPKNRRQPAKLKEKTPAKPLSQTERKPVDGNNGRRVNNERGRQLFNDSDSEGDNASDDDDADMSWSKNASELELDNTDSDYENSPIPKVRRRNNNTSKRQGRSDKSDYLTRTLNKSREGEIVYLNLTKEEVEVQDEVPESPPANHDITFATRLQDILESCRHKDQNKLPSSNKKTKRKLFTPNFGDDYCEIASLKEEETKSSETINKRNDNLDEILEDRGNLPFDSQGRPKIFDLVNKQLESVKTGKPIFQLTPPSTRKNPSSGSNKKTPKNANVGSDSGSTPKTKSHNEAIFKTPLSVKSKAPPKTLRDLHQTPSYKYSFLKSLDVTVSKALCHPDAIHYRENYRTKKEELSQILYDMYNEKLFENKLNVPFKWNKKLLNTAGRCLNKKRLGIRSSVVELSDKVLTSADRLRCTLIHELCHAATWIFNGEGGHGSSWKEWARRANAVFPEIPKIVVCHQYDIEYKYTYKCTLCGAKSHAHSRSKKVENIRCSYCHGAIEIFLNKKDKDGNVIPTPVKAATGFAKFVQDNYTKYKRDDLKHADVMKLLSNEFSSLKVSTN